MAKPYAKWFLIADLCAHPEQILRIASKRRYRSTDCSLPPQNHRRIANCPPARHIVFAGPFIAQQWGWLHKRLRNVSRRKSETGDHAASTYLTMQDKHGPESGEKSPAESWGKGEPIVREVYSGSNPTKSLASSAGNFSDPRLMSQIVRVERCVYQSGWSRCRYCLRSVCYHVTDVGGV